MEQLMNKCREQGTETLKEMVIALANDFRKEAGIALDAALNVLEERMNESDFIAFCETV